MAQVRGQSSGQNLLDRIRLGRSFRFSHSPYLRICQVLYSGIILKKTILAKAIILK